MKKARVFCRGCRLSEHFFAVQRDVPNYQLDMSGGDDNNESKMVRLSCRCGSTTWVSEENYELAKNVGQVFPEKKRS